MRRCLAVGRKAARQLVALAGQQGIQVARIGPDTLSLAGGEGAVLAPCAFIPRFRARLKVAYHSYGRLDRLLDGADLCFIRMGTRRALLPAESLMNVLSSDAQPSSK